MTHVPAQLRRGPQRDHDRDARPQDPHARGLATGLAHVAHLAEALQRFDAQALLAHDWGVRLTDVLTGGGRLLAAGNGGSAAEAQHLTAELVGRFRDERRPFSALCLSAETSTLTAICNDYPAEELFARQVEGHGRPGDVLVLLSTSGRSPNVLAAAERGRACGLTVWAMTGPAPNPLADLADEVLAVDAPTTATVQELQLVSVHLLCAAVDATLAARAGRRPEPAEVLLGAVRDASVREGSAAGRSGRPGRPGRSERSGAARSSR